MMKNDLHKLIENKEASVSIIGLGYVGLPLAIAVASSGMKVFGIDIAEEKINQLRQGISPMQEISSNELNVLIQENQFIPSLFFHIFLKVISSLSVSLLLYKQEVILI